MQARSVKRPPNSVPERKASPPSWRRSSTVRLMAAIAPSLVIPSRHAKANDAQPRRRRELEFCRRAHAVRQVRGQRDIRFDRLLVTGQAELLHRHPDFQRAEAARLLEAELAEPDRSTDPRQAAVRAQVG